MLDLEAGGFAGATPENFELDTGNLSDLHVGQLPPKGSIAAIRKAVQKGTTTATQLFPDGKISSIFSPDWAITTKISGCVVWPSFPAFLAAFERWSYALASTADNFKSPLTFGQTRNLLYSILRVADMDSPSTAIVYMERVCKMICHGLSARPAEYGADVISRMLTFIQADELEHARRDLREKHRPYPIKNKAWGPPEVPGTSLFPKGKYDKGKGKGSQGKNQTVADKCRMIMPQACMYFAQGNCQWGNKCGYKHMTAVEVEQAYSGPTRRSRSRSPRERKS